MRYRDAKRMIAWLQEAFGFEPQAVYEDDRGGVAHAQLTLGSGMIMLGSAREGDDEFGRVQSTPSVLGGTTQSPYLVIADADAIHRRAMAAGDRERQALPPHHVHREADGPASSKLFNS